MALTISKNDKRKIMVQRQDVSGSEFDYLGPNREQHLREGHNRGVQFTGALTAPGIAENLGVMRGPAMSRISRS